MKSLARFLRKLADFIDPRIGPSTDPMVVTINADTSGAMEAIESFRRAVTLAMEDFDRLDRRAAKRT